MQGTHKEVPSKNESKNQEKMKWLWKLRRKQLKHIWHTNKHKTTRNSLSFCFLLSFFPHFYSLLVFNCNDSNLHCQLLSFQNLVGHKTKDRRQSASTPTFVSSVVKMCVTCYSIRVFNENKSENKVPAKFLSTLHLFFFWKMWKRTVFRVPCICLSFNTIL